MKQPRFIPPTGNSNARLLIVGEAPGEIEEALGEHFVGPTGQIIQYDVTAAGETWTNVLRTNIFPWRPPDNNFNRIQETGHTLEEGLNLLWKLIEDIKPNCILATGERAFSVLTGYKLAKYRGSILSCTRNFEGNYKPKVVGTKHPASLYKRDDKGAMTPWWWRYIINFDIARAVEESRFKSFDLPTENISIVTSSYEVHQFIQDLYSRPDWIVATDIEALVTVPDCIGLASSPSRCIVVPLLEVPYARNQPKINIRERAAMLSMIARLLSDPRVKVIGQNIRYDAWRLQQALGIKIANIYADTMVMFSYLYPELPKNLGFIASLCTRRPYFKDEGKEFDWKKNDVRQRYIYNGKDCCATYESFVGLSKACNEYANSLGLDFNDWFYNYAMRLVEPYNEIETTGFIGNLEERNRLYIKYELMKTEAEAELFNIVGGRINIRSSANEIIDETGTVKRKEGDLPRVLKAFGFPPRASYDESNLSNLWAHHAKTAQQQRLIDLVLRLRGIYKTISTYLAAAPDWDGNYRCIINPYGTETDRSTTQIMGRKNPYRLEQCGWSMHTVTKHGDLGADLRRIQTCAEDEIIIEFDLSQAEPRIVAILSDDTDLLGRFGTIDIHRWTAKLCLGLTKEMGDISGDERFIGKTCRNAGNLGVGYRTLTTNINTDSKKYNIRRPDGDFVNITEGIGKRILDRFHQFTPRVKHIFHKGTQEALAANNYVLVNPFGRPRRFMGRRNDETTFKEAYAFMASSPVSGLVKRSLLKITSLRDKEKWVGLKVALEYHDALIFRMPEIRLRDWGPQIKEIMETPIDFSKCSLPRGTLKIPVEAKYGKNYRDLKDIKF